MKEYLKSYLGYSYLVSEDFFDSLKELRKQSVDFNHAWGIINNRRYRKNFGAMFAIINLSTGFASGRNDALFDSGEALEETYGSDEDELVFGEHLVDFNNTSQE